MNGGKPAGKRRTVVVAEPHGFCAGVKRAVALAEKALAGLASNEKIYCLHELVHNGLVVKRLASKGMVFVKDLSEAPDGARVFFSAHGVSPAIRKEAEKRSLRVTDATCGFVSRLHEDARRFAGAGFYVVFIGTRGHDETEGVVGEAPSRIVVVQDSAEAEKLDLPACAKVAVLTQTTLAAHRVKPMMDALRRRFPSLVVPERSGVCLATTERQEAVRALARKCSKIIVLGSPNSANSRRLAEVAADAGAEAVLLQDAAALADFAARGGLDGVETVGLTAGASTPEDAVSNAIALLENPCGE